MRKHPCLYVLVVVAVAVALASPDPSMAQQLSPKKRVTLLATCAAAQPTDERALTYIFTFDVQEVREGSFEDSQVIFAMRSEGGGLEFLGMVGGDPNKKKKTCNGKQRYELTVFVPPSNPHFASYGVNSSLQDWKKIEKNDD